MKKKIKVAIFVDGDFIPSYDGASNRFHYLSRYLALEGIEIVIFHGYRGWSDISLIKKEPFRTYVFPIKHYYDNLELIASLLIKEGVNIIQFDNLEPVLLQGVRLSQLTGAKLISEMHYVVRNLAKRLGSSDGRLVEIENIEKEVGKSIDHLICLSDQDKPFLLDYMNLDTERISVIPSGVDFNETQYLGSNFEEKNIVFLGNLFFKPNEDAVRVIKNEIYSKLKNHGFRFTIGGDCPIELKKELSDERFEFTGVVPDLNDLFKHATFALAPISEGTGMRIKLLNYLAFGVPIITTSIATDGFKQKEAFIIEDDYSKYADKILDLYNNKALLDKLSKKGFRIIKKKYKWSIIAKQTIDVYKKVLKQDFVSKNLNKHILKTKEPVWLQEAVAKNRFKQITNPDLPKKFSYCVLSKGEIKSYLMEAVVALEGMPGAGKTTFINNYINNTKSLSQLEIKNDKLLEKDNLKTSKQFLLMEKDKSSLIENFAKENISIIIDRSFLSTLAYCYARSKIKKDNDYKKLLKFYNRTKSNITFPTKLIILDVQNNESLQRRKDYRDNLSYSNWFNNKFLDYVREFYNNELSKFISIDVFKLDTTDMSVQDVGNKLKTIL